MRIVEAGPSSSSLLERLDVSCVIFPISYSIAPRVRFSHFTFLHGAPGWYKLFHGVSRFLPVYVTRATLRSK